MRRVHMPEALIASRMRAIRECFLADDLDENELRLRLVEFAQCDWDAGRDVRLDALQLNERAVAALETIAAAHKPTITLEEKS